MCSVFSKLEHYKLDTQPLPMKYWDSCCIAQILRLIMRFRLRIRIDVYVCWNSKRRLQSIVCLQRKTNLCSLFHLQQAKKFSISVFRLQQTNGSSHFPIVPFSVYTVYIYGKRKYMYYLYIDTYIYVYIYTSRCILPFQTENGNRSQGIFPYSVYHLLIVQTEVCRLSFC